MKEVNEVITSCLFRVESDKWENNIQTKGFSVCSKVNIKMNRIQVQ